ncbi:hypothetical protein KF840_01935 [bacterium]|nr:hypothetical protein [bacterium]
MWRRADRRLLPRLAGALLCALAATLPPGASRAAVVFVNLGTAAPPSTLGPFAVTPYDQGPQAAIPNMSNTSVIPGSPIPPDTTTSFAVQKRTVGDGWTSWSHGYGGPVFYTVPKVPPLALTIAPARAFYVYVEPAAFGSPFAVTVATNGGGASGPVFVDAAGGATGFGFYTTAGESITTVTIDADPNAGGFAFAELGLGNYGIGTPSPTPTPRPPLHPGGGCSLLERPRPSLAWWTAVAAIALWGLRRSRRARTPRPQVPQKVR